MTFSAGLILASEAAGKRHCHLFQEEKMKAEVESGAGGVRGVCFRFDGPPANCSKID